MHEQSETVQNAQGQWINIYGRGTPQAGQQLPGTRTHATVESAVSEAQQRSQAAGKIDAKTLLNDPDFKALPQERRDAVLRDAGLTTPQASSTAGAVGTAVGQFAQRANEGLIGALGFPFASKEFVDAYRQVAPPIPGAEDSAAGRIGEFVGGSAAMAAPAFGVARTAQALKNAYGAITEFGPTGAMKLMDWIGKAMGNVGGAKTPLQVAGREATAAVGGGAGGVAATEVFPDSKVAELGGQLIGALGPEFALKGVRTMYRQLFGRPASEAKLAVGQALREAIPEGSAGEAGLNAAVDVQQTTGLTAPVAQATKSPGVAAMESAVVSRHPDIAARTETRRAATSDVLRERVSATPGAEGDVLGSQQAVGRGLEADRAAAQAPVAEAEAMRNQAVQHFSQTAADVETKMQAAVTKAEQEGERLAASIRPTATGEEVGDQIQRQIIVPARQTMKDEADRLYALVDPADTTKLPLSKIEAAIAKARTDQGNALVESVPALDRLEAQIAKLRAAAEQEKGALSSDPIVPFNTVRRWSSALGDASEEALRGVEPNRRVSRLLAEVGDSVQSTLDDVVQTGPADVAERYAAAKSFFSQYADKFLSGVVAKVLQRGATGEDFKVAAEDVGKELFRSSTAKGRIRSIDQYLEAVGNEPGAKAALGDVALQDFFSAAYRSADGAIDPKAAMRWLRDHRGTLEELKRVGGPDLVPEVTKVIQQRQSVDQLREIATQGRKRLERGFLPQGGNPVAMAEQHLAHAERASARSLEEIDRSAAAKYVGADPDLAGHTLLTGSNPTQSVTEAMTAARGDAAAERGIRRSLLAQALEGARSPAVTATGNPLFDTQKFGRFLEDHAGPLRAAFGDEGVAYLKEQHRIAQMVLNPQAARVAPETMTETVNPRGLYTFVQLLGRVYQGVKGFASPSYLAGEGFGRKVARTFEQFNTAELKSIYEQALYDPSVAKDLRMMTFEGFSPTLVTQRLRAHLGPTLGPTAAAAASGEAQRPAQPGEPMILTYPQAPVPQR